MASAFFFFSIPGSILDTIRTVKTRMGRCYTSQPSARRAGSTMEGKGTGQDPVRIIPAARQLTRAGCQQVPSSKNAWPKQCRQRRLARQSRHGIRTDIRSRPRRITGNNGECRQSSASAAPARLPSGSGKNGHGNKSPYALISTPASPHPQPRRQCGCGPGRGGGAVGWRTRGRAIRNRNGAASPSSPGSSMALW